MKVSINTQIIIFAMLASTGCASNTPQGLTLEEKLANRGYEIGQAVDRIQHYRINGWNHLDRHNVILTVSASSRYLVTVRNTCDGLFSAETLAFSTTIGNLTTWDKLIVKSSGGFVEHCYIYSMHALNRAGEPSETA